MTSEMLRLLIFHPALAPYRVDLFNELARRCVVRVVFLHANVFNQAFDQHRLRRELLVDHGYIRHSLQLLKRTIPSGVHPEIRTFRPDVVVTSEFSPTTLEVLLDRRVLHRRFAHVIWTEDNLASVSQDVWLRTVSRSFVLPRTDGLIVYSDASARMYRERFAARCPIAVSPILQDETVFRSRLAVVNDTLRRIVSLHNLIGKRVLLYVGRLAPEKRVDRLIAAYTSIHRDFPDAVLVMVGDGPERTRLEGMSNAANLNNKLIFTGRKEGDELYAWYRAGALFALPSEYEPFGAVVNEALLAGLPVLCSNRAGASTLVNSYHAGTVIDAADFAALSAALGEWLRRVPPIKTESLDDLRPSLMSQTFQAAVTAFLDVARTAAASVS